VSVVSVNVKGISGIDGSEVNVSSSSWDPNSVVRPFGGQVDVGHVWELSLSEGHGKRSTSSVWGGEGGIIKSNFSHSAGIDGDGQRISASISFRRVFSDSYVQPVFRSKSDFFGVRIARNEGVGVSSRAYVVVVSRFANVSEVSWVGEVRVAWDFRSRNVPVEVVANRISFV
jgi:hypothetical protein